MNDGSIVFSTELDNKELEKQLNSLTKKIEAQQDQINKKQAKYTPLETDAKAWQQDYYAALKKLEQMQSGGGYYPKNEVSQQEAEVKRIETAWNGVQKKADAYKTQIYDATVELQKNKEKAGAVADELSHGSSAGSKMGEAMEKANKSADRFNKRLKAVVRSALIFTVITKTFAAFRDWLGKVVKTNAEASAAVGKLKAALLTLVQPLVSVIVPAFTSFINVLSKIITIAAQVASAIFGVSYEESQKAAESLYDETNALEGVGTAAKKAAKQLAPFDEINQLVSNSASDSATKLSEIAADFSKLNGGTAEWVTDLEVIFDGLKTSWNEGKLASNKDAWIIGMIALLGAIIGASVFKSFDGAVLGLVIGASLGVAAVEWTNELKNPDAAKTSMIGVLGSIMGAVLGKIFTSLVATTGVSGAAGLVLSMALGAGIALTAVEFFKQLNEGKWDSKDTWNTVLLAILGAVIGVLLSPAAPLVGAVIGLSMGLGIGVLAADFFDNLSDDKKKDAQNLFGGVMLTILSGIVGAIFGSFIFNPALGAFLGIAIGSLIGFSSVDFSKELTETVKEAAKKALEVAMIALFFGVLGVLFTGFSLAGGVVGVVLGLAIGWGSVKVEDIPSSRLGLGGGSTSGSGAGRLSSATSSYDIPMLAQGAVIPPNREFMAVLGDQKSGTNIEAPLSTIEQAVQNVLNLSGGSGEIVINYTATLDGEVVHTNQQRISRRHGKNLVNG